MVRVRSILYALGSAKVKDRSSDSVIIRQVVPTLKLRAIAYLRALNLEASCVNFHKVVDGIMNVGVECGHIMAQPLLSQACTY